jgi:chemotaxis family two-component system sensor kinase Cph1
VAESGARITSGPLPRVPIAATMLLQLFQNLIGNAVKFRGERPPEIHVGAEESASEWIFSVRDNGIGIDPRHTDKIFLIFQRLHARDKFPGTGVGLAVCKKIVEQRGGRIWFESQKGEGSVFRFALPKPG